MLVRWPLSLSHGRTPALSSPVLIHCAPRASRHLLAATMCRRLEDELVAIAQLEKRAWRASIEVRRPRASRACMREV